MMTDNETFYRHCAKLLETEYDCKPFPWHYRTRWNNRAAGSGRYPGFGIIRKFGDQIQVSLVHPVTHTKVYNSEQEVYKFLISIMEDYNGRD